MIDMLSVRPVLYLIEILHQTTTASRSKFENRRLYLIEILHQTTTPPCFSLCRSCCILSKFYIKPQHFDCQKRINYVVSYRNSTSNHNSDDVGEDCVKLYLIEILHQTTTVNVNTTTLHPLYLIEILHQTTTRRKSCEWLSCCILSKFYIKPQLISMIVSSLPCCILSKFYIKPQQPLASECFCGVVSYRNSTSNHNRTAWHRSIYALYLIEILHQTTTPAWTRAHPLCCILSKFYIKPQLHPSSVGHGLKLYLIEILHQTTTCTCSAV